MRLNPPRADLPLTDSSGRITREWYKYLVGLERAQTDQSDLLVTSQLDSAASDAIALSATAGKGEHLLFAPCDPVATIDNTLLALWPGNQT